MKTVLAILGAAFIIAAAIGDPPEGIEIPFVMGTGLLFSVCALWKAYTE